MILGPCIISAYSLEANSLHYVYGIHSGTDHEHALCTVRNTCYAAHTEPPPCLQSDWKVSAEHQSQYAQSVICGIQTDKREASSVECLVQA